MILRIDELCKKDVINVENGCRIGYVSDLEIDTESGQVCALLIAHSDKNLSFRKPECMRLEWSNIAVMGDEAVLVKNAGSLFEEKKETKHIFDYFTK